MPPIGVHLNARTGQRCPVCDSRPSFPKWIKVRNGLTSDFIEVCDGCVGEEYVICEYCGEWVHRDDAVKIDTANGELHVCRNHEDAYRVQESLN